MEKNDKADQPSENPPMTKIDNYVKDGKEGSMKTDKPKEEEKLNGGANSKSIHFGLFLYLIFFIISLNGF